MTSIRQTRCSVCSETGHNMTTCQQLPLRMSQTHQDYVTMWVKWVEAYAIAAVFDRHESMDYFHRADAIEVENRNWLRNPLHFRLLKLYLNLNGRGTDQEIRVYMVSLYRYLVIKKKGLFPYIITNQYANYDYLLHTIRTTLNTRQYDIIVEQKTTSNDELLETCVICYENYPTNNFVKTNCEHSFCQICVINTVQILPDNKKLSCAMCRSNINHLSCYTSQINTNLKNILNL